MTIVLRQDLARAHYKQRSPRVEVQWQATMDMAWTRMGSKRVIFPMPQAFALAGTYTRHSSLDQALSGR